LATYNETPDGGSRTNGTALVYTDERYWLGSTTDWSDSDNWAGESGGTSGAPVPTSVSRVYFDSGTNPCTLDVDVDVIDWIVTSGYDGTIDFAGQNVSFTNGRFIVDGGTWYAGEGTITFTDSTADIFNTTDWIEETHDTQIYGSSFITASWNRRFDTLTVNTGATLTTTNAWWSNGVCNIYGDFIINNLWTKSGSTITVDPTGTITLNSGLTITSGVQVTNNGIITGTGTLQSSWSTGTLHAATYDVNVRFIGASWTEHTIFLDSTGTYTFNKNLTIDQNTGYDYNFDFGGSTVNILGDLTSTEIDQSVNFISSDSSLVFEGDVSLAANTTWAEGSGDISFDGSGDQNIDFASVGLLEAIDVDKTSGTLTFASDIVSQQLTITDPGTAVDFSTYTFDFFDGWTGQEQAGVDYSSASVYVLGHLNFPLIGSASGGAADVEEFLFAQEVMDGGAAIGGTAAVTLFDIVETSGGVVLSSRAEVRPVLDVYYSVCTFGTSSIMTGSPNLTITNGVANLTVAQTGNIGVGCRITYDGASIAYIHSVNSPTSFNVRSAVGNKPDNEDTEVTVNSIAHEFASLNAAVNESTGWGGSSHIGSWDLVDKNVMVRIACYYDHDNYTPDTRGYFYHVGQNYDVFRHVIAFTPTGGTESINNQRHSGVFDTTKYYVKGITQNDCLRSYLSYVEWIGLQAWMDTAGTGKVAISGGYGVSDQNNVTVDSCIAKRTLSSYTTDTSQGIGVGGGGTGEIRNCIVHGFYRGIYDSHDPKNCTVTKCYRGYRTSYQSVTYTNCIAWDCDDVDFEGTAKPGSDYNMSKDDSATGANSIHGDTDVKTVDFVDSTNEDFHLLSTSDAIGAGTTLSFDYDIDGQNRVSWDIGADEFKAVYDETTEGGTIASGAAIEEHIAGYNTYNETMQGGIVSDGEHTQTFIDFFDMTGGVKLDGISSDVMFVNEVMEDGVVISGDHTQAFIDFFDMTGGAKLHGVALNRVFADEMMEGGVEVGGNAHDVYGTSFIASGGMVIAGATNPTFVFVPLLSGGVLSNGLTDVQLSYDLLMNSGAMISGVVSGLSLFETGVGGSLVSGVAIYVSSYYTKGGVFVQNRSNTTQNFNEKRDAQGFDFGEIVYVKIGSQYILTTVLGFDGYTYQTEIGFYPIDIVFNESEYAAEVNKDIGDITEEINDALDDVSETPVLPIPEGGQVVVTEEDEHSDEYQEIYNKLVELENVPPVAPHVSRMYRY